MPTPEHIEALAQRINQRNLGCCIDCNAHARGKGIEHINDIEQARDIAADILAITARPGPTQGAVIAALIEGGVLREELGIFRDGDPAMDGPRRILCGTPKSRDAAHEYLRIVRDGRTVEVRLVTEWRAEA